MSGAKLKVEINFKVRYDYANNKSRKKCKTSLKALKASGQALKGSKEAIKSDVDALKGDEEALKCNRCIERWLGNIKG